MTDNERLENVPPSLKLVRILNHAIKGMIKVNSWKNRSKLFQRSEINHVVWWVRTSKTLSQTFSKCDIFFSLSCHYFFKKNILKNLLHKYYWIPFNYFFKFNQSLAPQIACKSLRLSEGRFVFHWPCANS